MTIGKNRNDNQNLHWREEAKLLGVDPEEPDDAKYWSALERARGIIDSFHYHQPTEEQIGRISRVRCGAIDFAKIVLQNVQSSADQTHALRTIHEAMMTANKGIVTEKVKS